VGERERENEKERTVDGKNNQSKSQNQVSVFGIWDTLLSEPRVYSLIVELETVHHPHAMSFKEEINRLEVEQERIINDLQLQVQALGQQQQQGSRHRIQRAFSIIPLPKNPKRANPVELGIIWRLIFFCVAFTCQAYFILYAITGERAYR